MSSTRKGRLRTKDATFCSLFPQTKSSCRVVVTRPMTARHVLLVLLSRSERHSGARCAVAADITNGQRRFRSVVEVFATAHGIAGAVSGVPSACARAHGGRWYFADHVAGADIAADAHGFGRDLTTELWRATRGGATWSG